VVIKFQDVNDPCDCGSGLKLKDCHLKPILPKEFFKVKITNRTGDYFVEYVNGQYRRIPGRIMMKISAVAPEYVYEDVIEILKPLRDINIQETVKLERYTSIIRELNLQKNQDSILSWTNRINKLQHKLNSLKNRMKTFSEHEMKFEEKCKKEYTDSIVEYEEIDPIYVDETESFLFQAKSALDILAQIIGIAYRLSGAVTYSDDGNDLIDKLRKSSAFRNNAENKEEMIKVIERNKDWIKDLVNMRDLITHFSDLVGFKSAIHSPSSQDNEYVNIYYPSMPNLTRVTTYMNDILLKIFTLISEVTMTIKKLHV
jgi:hypothetical protein